MNAITQMAQTLTRQREYQPMVITYTTTHEYRPGGYALAMLRELKQRRVPMTRAELAQVVGIEPQRVNHTLDPARRYGVVRLVDQAWEWCA